MPCFSSLFLKSLIIFWARLPTCMPRLLPALVLLLLLRLFEFMSLLAHFGLFLVTFRFVLCNFWLSFQTSSELFEGSVTVSPEQESSSSRLDLLVLCTGDFLQSFRYIWCSSWICYKESDENSCRSYRFVCGRTSISIVQGINRCKMGCNGECYKKRIDERDRTGCSRT